MRKEKAGSVATNGEFNGVPRITRTTVFLTDVLNENLDALALTTGEAKGEIVRKALSEYMEKKGMQPDKRPKIKVSY